MNRKTLLTLPLLIALASPVLAEDDKALLAKCDHNKNGEIDRPATYGLSKRDTNQEQRETIQRENRCRVEFESARLDAELAKGKEELAKGKAESARLDDEYRKMIQILALLRPAEARTYLADEIQKVEKEISEAKAANNRARVKPLEHQLNILRTEQQKLK